MDSGSFTPLHMAEAFAHPDYLQDVVAELKGVQNLREAELNARGEGEDLFNDGVWCELDTDAALLQFGLRNGFNFPFLFGLPSISQRRLAFEDFVPSPDVGFWLTPNLDTFTMIAASLMQFTNFSFAPAKVAR